MRLINRRIMRTLVVCVPVAALTAGCAGGGSATSELSKSAVPGPHGGIAMPLPAGDGYAEVVVEMPQTAANIKGQPQSLMLVYFLGKDLKSALSPQPSAASLSIVLPDKEAPVAVTLTPDAAGGTGRFASGPGLFDYDEMHGEVIATIGGREVKAPFTMR